MVLGHLPRRLVGVMFVAGVGGGCAGSADGARPAPSVTEVAPSVDARAVKSVAGPAPPPSVSSKVEAAPTETASAVPSPLGRDRHSVVACDSDGECGWDDPCFPTRCVEARAGGACNESAPPPGQCLCFQGACTAKPTRPPLANVACEESGCVLDRAAGVCIADTDRVPWNVRTNPGLDAGPTCDCVTPAKGCTFQWLEPIPCKSERDCWVKATPRPHPVRRPGPLRGRDFKPCSEDGEIAPRCTEQGFCALGLGFRC